MRWTVPTTIGLLLAGCHVVLPLDAVGQRADKEPVLAGDTASIVPDGPRPEGDSDPAGDGPFAAPIDDGAASPEDDAPGIDSDDAKSSRIDGPQAPAIDGPQTPATDGTWTLAISSTPPKYAAPNRPYEYQAQVNTSAPVTWSLFEGPQEMMIDASTGLVQWLDPVVGTATVHLRVADGTSEAEQRYSLIVRHGGAMNGLRPAQLAALLRDSATRSRLVESPLSGDGLPLALVRELDAPGGRPLLSYLVGCALEAGDVLEVPTTRGVHSFKGELGLAPGWRNGPCDRTCQQWVSACVAARVSADGNRVPIVLAGDHPALGRAPGRLRRNVEGAFFGNLFAPVPRVFACGAASDFARNRGRRCAGDQGACMPIEMVGPCRLRCQRGARGFNSCKGTVTVWIATVTVLLP